MKPCKINVILAAARRDCPGGGSVVGTARQRMRRGGMELPVEHETVKQSRVQRRGAWVYKQ